MPGKQLSLLGEDGSGYRYGVLVTNGERSVAGVGREYRGRADCENRIKELKADFGLETIGLNNFGATESAVNMAMMAYNLMSMFRQAVMRSESATHAINVAGQGFGDSGTLVLR